MGARLLLVAAALMLAGIGIAGAATNPSKGSGTTMTYRWVDEKGVTHYGDRLPPQYSQQESSILNDQGVEVGRHEAQKTPAQLAEEARIRQEQLEKKQRDSFLLTTYASVDDIVHLRDLRLDQIKGQRVVAEQYIADLHERLVALQVRAMVFKPYSASPNARRMPDALAEDLMRSLNEMRTQRSTLTTKDKEETLMRAQFQADIDRYRELRSPRTATR